MGCWNETCFITHMPIHEGDVISVFMIKGKGRRTQTQVYGTDEWAPNALPMKAKYNDYGGIESLSELTSEEVIRANKVLLGLEENESLEDYINDKVRRDEIDDQSAIYALYDVFEKGIEKVSQDKYWRSDEDNIGFKTDENIELMHKLNQQIKELEFDNFAQKWEIRSKIQDNDIHYFMIRESEIDPVHFDIVLDSKIVLSPFDNLYLFNSFLSYGRMRWYVPAGSGSQQDEFNYQLLVSKLIVERAEKRYEDRLTWEDGLTDQDKLAIRKSMGLD